MIESIVIPPPPPLIEFKDSLKNNVHVRKENVKSIFKSDHCSWATEYPEIQEACCLAHICTNNKPKFFRFKRNIRAIIQNGPTCGLTALTMLTGGSLSTADILNVAKDYKYTNHGEMFSTKNIAKLAEQIFDTLGTTNQIESYSGILNCKFIEDKLKNGACILVAYPFFRKLK